MADEFVDEERPPVQGARVGAQAVVLLVIAGIFGWYVHVLVNHPDGGTGSLSQDSWVYLLLTLMVILLVIMLLLRDPLFTPRPRSEAWDEYDAPESERYTVGCPACGTVFYRTQEELADGRFHCNNCGREGRVEHHYLRRSQIRIADCAHCGHTYEQFRQESECPVCHEHNSW